MFDPTQKAFAQIYFWAAYVGDYKLINLFLDHLGMSPFIGLKYKQSPVMAAVMNYQMGVLEYFCRRKFKTSSGEEKDRYTFQQNDLKAQWEKDREMRIDKFYNNVMHFVFTENDKTKRNNILELLLSENIGNPGQRNTDNFLPIQIQHLQPVHNLPPQYKHVFF